MSNEPEKGETIPLVEERLTLGKLRVRTHTESVETTVAAELDGEEIEITRVPVDRIVDAAPKTRVEGELTILPVMEERLVVEKRLVLKEEIHIRRRSTRENVDVPVSLRRQHAVVERIDPETGPSTGQETEADNSEDPYPHQKD